MRREKWRRKENLKLVGAGNLTSECLPSELPTRIEDRHRVRDDFRCAFCGTYEDLRGHVDTEESSEIFFLCGTCCKQLHG